MCKKRLELVFGPEIVGKAITYNLIKKYDVIINVFQARILPDEEGYMVVDIKAKNEESIKKSVEYLQSEGVTVDFLEKSISYNQDRCINCGACTGVCRSGALLMDQESWELIVDQDKCLLCEMCLSACSMKALSLEIR